MEAGRRSHRKSRKGCVQCKKRKIKCDETKPACNNCIRHKTSCFYTTYSTHSTSAAPDQAGNLTTQKEAKALSSEYGTGVEAPNASAKALGTSFSMLEMELLHLYTTYTSITFEPDPVIQAVWRIYAPQIGFQYPFVMDAIIAITALHRAYSRPNEREQYTELALQRHERGLEQATCILSNVTNENVIAVFLFSALTGKITFARPRKRDDWLLIGQHGIADWLLVIRGTMSIINKYREPLINSEAGPLLTNGIRRLRIWEVSGNRQHKFLDDLIARLESFVEDPETLGVYKDAVRTLGRSYSLVPQTQSQHRESTDAYIWFFEVSDEYLQLLYSKSQEAISIFAFYCAFLKQMEFTWFLEGWSTHLISVIWKTLDYEHRIWIQWAVERIGWIPG